MILSDRDLHCLLGQMQFETEDATRLFNVDQQMQPCSVDLRLDRHFWKSRKPSKGKCIDLRQGGVGEVNVSRLFRAHRLHAGEGLTLKPGEMVLARTFEKFTIPNGYAGKIEGRSSYSRLGLSIHCTGDFMNPGWRGHMPLQLVNHGRVPIILTPYIHIAQLLVVQTSSESERPYGSDERLGHKYTDDDGGPSKYWMDQNLKTLHNALSHGNLPPDSQSRLLRALGAGDPELLDRFAVFFGRLTPSQITNPREILEWFAKKDERRHAWARRRLLFYRFIGLVLVGPHCGDHFSAPIRQTGIILVVLRSGPAPDLGGLV